MAQAGPKIPSDAPPLGLGGSQLGSMFREVSDSMAAATLASAWQSGIRWFDTAPFYGRGLAERRFGDFLRTVERDDFVLSTKVGRVLFPVAGDLPRGPGTVGALPNDYRFDYSYAGVLRSHDESLARLGLDRIDWLLIHDLDPVMHAPEELERHLDELANGGFRALAELKAAGRIRAIGAGLNTAGMTRRLLERGDLDFVLLALSYNLLDRDAEADDLPLCLERDVPALVGAPFCSGVLAAGGRGTYRYATSPPDVQDRVRAMAAACMEHDVPLAAAALQFPLRHAAVHGVVPGLASPAEVEAALANLACEIPDDLWSALG